jgi:hypothetical protein
LKRDNLLGDTDVRIRDMDAVPRDVVKTIVDVNTRLRLTSNQLNGFKKGPWSMFPRQVIRAAALDHSNMRPVPLNTSTCIRLPCERRIGSRRGSICD